MMPLDRASAHNDPPSVTTSLLCGSLLSTSDLIMRSKFPSLAWREDPLWQIVPSFDQESSKLPYRLAASCNCWFFIAKAYQVVPCLIISWSLIVLPSLKPIPDFVHLKSLVVCSPLVHRVARLHVTSLFGFAMWVTSSMRPPLLILGVLAYPWTQFPLPCMTALNLKRCHHEQAFSHDLLASCAWSLVRENSTAYLLLSGWQVVLITTLPWIVPVRPGASQARTCKTECVTPF
jgi:hypothetical protein